MNCLGDYINKFLKKQAEKGFIISWTDGPAFDPTDQVRTDPLADIAKSKEAKDERNRKEVK
jgi:hypothetical protein